MAKLNNDVLVFYFLGRILLFVITIKYKIIKNNNYEW